MAVVVSVAVVVIGKLHFQSRILVVVVEVVLLLTHLYEGLEEILIEILVNLLLVDVGEEPADGLQHEHQHQQDGVLK